MLLLHRCPTVTRIELSHCGCCLCGGLAQILLKQHAILVDDEGHYPRIAVFRGIGDEGESADHFSIGHVILRPAWCVRALPLEHTEVVTMERRVGVRLYVVSFIGRESRKGPKRTFFLAFSRFPVQAVLLALVADKLQSELMRAS